MLLAGAVQLARRAAADLPGLGDQRAGQLLRHHRAGTRRHQRIGRLRAAVQHRRRRDRGRPLDPQKLIGVTHPVDAANDFVITPLRTQQQSADVTAALARGTRRAPISRPAWATAYDTRADRRRRRPDAGRDRRLRPGAGARPGADRHGAVRRARRRPDARRAASTRPTSPSRSCSWATAPTSTTRPPRRNLQGNTWGMMNETGSYPGQAWLWVYSFWYQIPRSTPTTPTIT